jgi:uncharacterized repeat protein (TIGR01451 family)
MDDYLIVAISLLDDMTPSLMEKKRWVDKLKAIILMGDAPPHDPEPFTSYILTSVTIAAELADPVHIYTIQIGGPVEKFAELASQTGGEVFTAENAEEVVDAILEAIEEITKRPIADADGPYNGYIGFSITFDGTGSYDPDGTIVSYEWDLDDDGEFDDATGPTPSYTWNSEYTGNISLKVTDNDGKEDIDISTVTVTELTSDIVTLTKSGSPNPVAPGGTLSYTIRYSNAGTISLTDVTITENYPKGMTFISAGPAPDAGTNNKWTLRNSPGRCIRTNNHKAEVSGIEGSHFYREWKRNRRRFCNGKQRPIHRAKAI